MQIEKQNTEEKIVPLNEDLKGHTQDEVSYQKALLTQQKEMERLKSLKK